jgi:aspartate kinase
MSLIVQKYGGTSVGNTERIRSAAKRIASWHQKGNQLVIVVSAMSGVTDSLLKLAREITPEPSDREIDMLLATGEQTSIALMSMALHSLGVPAISLTGAQAGIITDGVHNKAKISNISPHAIRKFLAKDQVVIVAGFQGQTMEGQITTLGRGGSDLTAIALATVLKADLCQIYTDVEGVYTTDPRIVSEAKKINEISYDELLEMASLGSKVMQARSVEFAKKFNVPFEVRSSFNDQPGTLVKEETASMEDVVVRGVSLERNQAKVIISGVPDKPGHAAAIFTALAGANVNIDMIIQNVSQEADGEYYADMTFTLHKDDLTKAKRAIQPLIDHQKAREVRFEEGIAKVSVVGIGMRSHSGVAAMFFTALGESGANIEMIATSEIKISVVVDESHAEAAVKAAHKKFNLDEKTA